jgi:U3 small nucleolar RNA-associated protein 25
MSTEVKLLTLLNVSAIKRPRALDLPGGFRSPSAPASRATSVSSDEREAKRAKANGNGTPAGKKGKKGKKEEEKGEGEEKAKPRRSVAWGGEMGPSGSTYGKKEKKDKGKKAAAPEGMDVDADAEAEADAPVEEDAVGSDDEADDTEDTFNTHFGAETPLMRTDVVAAATEEWVSTRGAVKGLGNVVEVRPRGVEKCEGRARVSTKDWGSREGKTVVPPRGLTGIFRFAGHALSRPLSVLF